MRWMVIAFPLTIFMDVVMFVGFFMWERQATYEFEQRQLDLQVNYSVDAAVQEMLISGTHLDTDYADWGTMTVEPEVALDVYLTVLLRNFGWADTEQNRTDLVESSIPLFCVAAYDGYYVYGKQREEQTLKVMNGGPEVDVMTFEPVWTPKLPYSETIVNNDASGKYDSYTTYFYNLGAGQDQEYEGSNPLIKTVYGKYESKNDNLTMDNLISEAETSQPGTRTHARDIINRCLSDACNSAMYISLEGNTDKQWYLPASYSQWSENRPVVSPSVLTYISRADKMVQYDTVTFGIGGSKIDDAQFCILYEGNQAGHMVKLYTYATNRELVENKYGHGVIDYVTSSTKEAAQRGYYFDTSIE